MENISKPAALKVRDQMLVDFLHFWIKQAYELGWSRRDIIRIMNEEIEKVNFD